MINKAQTFCLSHIASRCGPQKASLNDAFWRKLFYSPELLPESKSPPFRLLSNTFNNTIKIIKRLHFSQRFLPELLLLHELPLTFWIILNASFISLNDITYGGQNKRSRTMIRRHENVTVLLKRWCFAVGMYKSSVCVILQAHFCSCRTHQAADGSIETFIFFSHKSYLIVLCICESRHL